MSWLPLFPNTATALTRFPSAVSDLFKEAGFTRTAVIDVDNGGAETATEAAAWARRMRNADAR